jgi:hypothetical protein
MAARVLARLARKASRLSLRRAEEGALAQHPQPCTRTDIRRYPCYPKRMHIVTGLIGRGDTLIERPPFAGSCRCRWR